MQTYLRKNKIYRANLKLVFFRFSLEIYPSVPHKEFFTPLWQKKKTVAQPCTRSTKYITFKNFQLEIMSTMYQHTLWHIANFQCNNSVYGRCRLMQIIAVYFTILEAD